MRYKRVRVILNPHGGKGDAQQLFNQRVLPLFQIAGIQCDLEITKYAGTPLSSLQTKANAKDMALTHEPDKYEGVLLVSGDGLVNEFVNGLMQRLPVDRIFNGRVDCCYAIYNTPICHISAGTQNQIAGGMGTRCFETAAYCIIKVSPRIGCQRSTESKEWMCCASLRTICLCSIRCAGLSRGSEAIW